MPATKPPDRERIELGKFEGKKVAEARMTITKTGDGLSDAMHVDPVKLHHGDEVYVVIKGVVVDIRHPEAKEGLARLHVVRAVEAVVVDADLAEPQLAEQRDRIAAAVEAAAVEAGHPPLIGRDDVEGAQGK